MLVAELVKALRPGPHRQSLTGGTCLLTAMRAGTSSCNPNELSPRHIFRWQFDLAMTGSDVNKHLAGATVLAATLFTAAFSVPASASPAIAQASRLTCGASMTNSHPADYTSTGIKVRTAAYADIETVAHYKTVTHRKYRTANGAGQETVWYYISGATPGYRVVVDVYVSRHGSSGSCSTSFTPHR
jgi:hypothetical protein